MGYGTFRRLPISDSLPLIEYNWIVIHHKGVDRNSLPRRALEYLDFLKTLPNKIVRWVLDWTDCFKPALHTKLDFISLLETQGIMAYTLKRFLRQLERIQGSLPTLTLIEFTINFDKKIYPN